VSKSGKLSGCASTPMRATSARVPRWSVSALGLKGFCEGTVWRRTTPPATRRGTQSSAQNGLRLRIDYSGKTFAIEIRRKSFPKDLTVGAASSYTVLSHIVQIGYQ